MIIVGEGQILLNKVCVLIHRVKGEVNIIFIVIIKIILINLRKTHL